MNAELLLLVWLLCVTLGLSLQSNAQIIDDQMAKYGNTSAYDRNCPKQLLSPENIMITIIASPRYYDHKNKDNYLFNLETMKFYAKLHGYLLKIVDPDVYMKIAGSMNVGPHRSGIIQSSKGLILRQVMKEAALQYGCQFKWLLFLDVDIVMLDLTRSLESIIYLANKLHQQGHYADIRSVRVLSNETDIASAASGKGKLAQLLHRKCDVIAQLAPTTVNTGLMFFRATSNTEQFITHWTSVQRSFAEKGVFWQDEQGWFQYMYLLFLERVYGRSMPLNCAARLETIYRGQFAMGNNGIRSKCFAKNFYLFSLLPKPDLLVSAASQQAQFSSSSSSSSETGSASVRGSSNNAEFCLFSGMTSEDKINLKDWETNTAPLFHNVTGEMLYRPQKYDKKGKATVSQTCKLNNMFLYHGKNQNTVSKLKELWSRTSAAARTKFDSIHGPYRSGTANETIAATQTRKKIRVQYPTHHLYSGSIDDEKGNDERCAQEVYELVMEGARSDWNMAESWRKTEKEWVAAIAAVKAEQKQ